MRTRTVKVNGLDVGPEPHAGRIVAALLAGSVTTAQATAELEPLGYTFCRPCFAFRGKHHLCWPAWSLAARPSAPHPEPVQPEPARAGVAVVGEGAPL